MLSDMGPEWNPLAISAPFDSCMAPCVQQSFNHEVCCCVATILQLTYASANCADPGRMLTCHR